MTKKILLHFDIPLSNDSHSGVNIYFYKWIPTESNPIIVKEEDYTLKLWIDKDCIASLFGKDDEKIASWTNISVYKIKANINIQNIEHELATFIYDERDNSKELHHGILPSEEKYSELNQKFIDLGFKAVKIAYTTCNKLISFARNTKGQYNLELLTYNEEQLQSLYVHLEAKCKIDEGDWFRWSPSSIDVIQIIVGEHKECITENDWAKVQEFIESEHRTNLVNELLSNAKSLLFKYEHKRSAIIEAATALEVALSKFADQPDFEKIDLPTDIGRINTKNLKNQISHLGFSGSMNYLIPVLFKDKVFSTELLTKCHDAISSRNNIVHQGQRGVNTEKAIKHVEALTKCCEILMMHTKAE